MADHVVYRGSGDAKFLAGHGSGDERANRTLQDRLVKALRLAKISTIEAANAFVPEFMERYNAQFSKVPARSYNLHRALNVEPDRLHEILCWKEKRYVTAQLAVSFERKRLILDENEVTSALTRTASLPFDMCGVSGRSALLRPALQKLACDRST